MQLLERANLQVNIPDDLSGFLDVVRDRLLKIRYLHRIRATFETDDSRFVRAVARREVIKEGRCVQGG